MKALRFLVLLCGLTACLAPVDSSAGRAPANPAKAAPCAQVATHSLTRPNIIFILSDDQTSESMDFMPQVRRLLADQGVTFTNFFVTLSTCCPSRVSILRGQYPHNHGVASNLGPDGGFPKFHALGEEASTVATWLHAAGYRTALLGKYLNDYPGTGPLTYVPPGWDEWLANMGNYYQLGTTVAYYDYVLNHNGQIDTVFQADSAYSTDLLSRRSQEFICREVSDSEPFFLYLALAAPHEPSTPARRHAGEYAGVPAPRSPSFNEADVSDKPATIRDRPLLTPDSIAAIDTLYDLQLESLQSVDEMVANLVAELTSTHLLANTYIFYMSDNGFHMGEHRLPPGKTTIYEEDIKVPFVVRGPTVPSRITVDQLTLNNDIAPTFAELAGATPASFVDGRSFAPLLTGAIVPWRKAFIAELQTTDTTGAAIRTQRYLLRWAGPELEMYDLQADPYELNSLGFAHPDTAVVRVLTDWLEHLKTCAAATCRAVEDSIF